MKLIKLLANFVECQVDNQVREKFYQNITFYKNY